MADTMPEALGRMLDKGRIDADDVLTLRRNVFGDGVVQAREAEWLFRLNDACEAGSREWPAFFVEALVDYTVHQADPHGYVSEDNARWLVERISASGIVKTETELELLIRVLEEALNAPESLIGFALAQAKAAVVDGTGPVRSGASLGPGRVGKAEVEVMRRMLYAYGGSGNIAVTRTEADLLFAINDVTRGADNDPEWSDLFVKAIANHLMADHGHTVPTRQVALARAEWLDDTSISVGRFFTSAISGGLKGIWEAYRLPDAAEERLARQHAAVATAERVDADEARWLANHLERYSWLADHEIGLLAFIVEESPHYDAALRPLIDKAGVAEPAL